MSKITIDDLIEWMDENGEDPIVDGPYYLDEEFEQEFLKGFSKDFLDAILEYNELESTDDLGHEHFIIDVEDFETYAEFDILEHFSLEDNEEYEHFIWEKFVDTLNKLSYENKFV